MDIISHGLWGGIAFGRRNKRQFWWSFFFGIMPDLLSFGILTASVWLGIGIAPDWSGGPPAMSSIPSYVSSLYNVTHSLVVFVVVFLIAWLILKRPPLVMLAWPLHIIVDIFTHTSAFFPTPFLWPIFNVKVSLISWADPRIFIPNVLLLLIVYAIYYVRSKKASARV